MNSESTAETVDRARWYPNMPPALSGETDDQYTNRLTGADRTGRVPYDHARNRQCSIGWHEECSDRDHSGQCECPHHEEMRNAEQLVTDWNAQHPPGTRVTLPLAPEEPPTVTAGAAFADRKSPWVTWPVVVLEGFDNPVTLSWLYPCGDPVITGTHLNARS